MTTSNSAGPQETRIVEMVFPNQTNHYGTLFGGAALRLMDMAAFVAASRHARRPVVAVGTTRWPVYEHEASIHDQTPEAMEHLPHEAVLLVRLLVAHRLGILLNTC